MALLAIVAVEYIVYARLISQCRALLKIIKKSTKVIKSGKISDHWKEKAIRFYALQLARFSIKLLLIGAGLGIMSIMLVMFVEITLDEQTKFLETISSVNGQLILIFIAAIYGFIRSRIVQ